MKKKRKRLSVQVKSYSSLPRKHILLINTNRTAMAFCSILTDIFIYIILYKVLNSEVIRHGLWLPRGKIETSWKWESSKKESMLKRVKYNRQNKRMRDANAGITPLEKWPVGFDRDLNPRPLRYRCNALPNAKVVGSNPVQSLNFFRSFFHWVVVWLHLHPSFFHYLIATVGHLLPRNSYT